MRIDPASVSRFMTPSELRVVDLKWLQTINEARVLRQNVVNQLLDDVTQVQEVKDLYDIFACDHAMTEYEQSEFYNRFRLLGSSENVVRVYDQSENEAFRRALRTQEFYALALNQLGQPDAAIDVCTRLLDQGLGNAMLAGIRGDSLSLKAAWARSFTEQLQAVRGDIYRVQPQSVLRFADCFCQIDHNQPADQRLKIATVQLANSALSQAWTAYQTALASAMSAYRDGFLLSGKSYPGLGWMRCVIERDGPHSERPLRTLFALLAVALDMEGGAESVDYWIDAGRIELACARGDSIESVRPMIRAALAKVDAEYKLDITIRALTHIRRLYTGWRGHIKANHAGHIRPAAALPTIDWTMTHLARAKQRFSASPHALPRIPTTATNQPSANPNDQLLHNTLSFRVLTGSPVPHFVKGEHGRVPDLVISRLDQQNLRTVITHDLRFDSGKEHPTGSAGAPGDPTAMPQRVATVLAALKRIVRQDLNLRALQDLRSAAHREFDLKSAALRRLSAVELELERTRSTNRCGRRSMTNLSMIQLAQLGDCREAMYLLGALFATWQQIEFERCVRATMECLDQHNEHGQFNRHRVSAHLADMEQIRRFELRGGFFRVYVEAIAVQDHYNPVRLRDNDPTVVARPYGLAELKAGQALTDFERQNHVLLLTEHDDRHFVLRPTTQNGFSKPSLPCDPVTGAVHLRDLERYAQVRLLCLVEEHALCLLHDHHTQEWQFADAFYDHTDDDPARPPAQQSPYQFGCGKLEPSDLSKYDGLLRAGWRRVIHLNLTGRPQHDGCHQTFIEPTPFSGTQRIGQSPSLSEGDIPGQYRMWSMPVRIDNFEHELHAARHGHSDLRAFLDRLTPGQPHANVSGRGVASACR